MEDIFKNFPKPPSLGLTIAVILELSIAATFAVNHSVIGIVLCIAYFYFSATCVLLFPPND